MPNVHTSHVNSVFCLDILNQALFEVLRHCPTKTEEEKLYILKIFSPKNCLFRVQVLRRPHSFTSPHWIFGTGSVTRTIRKRHVFNEGDFKVKLQAASEQTRQHRL